MEQKYKILIAEDEDSLRVIYDEYLSSEGFEVYTAKNGQEAIDIAKKHNDELDLILLDVMMPQVDGMTALETLKKDENTKKIRVFLMTVLGNEAVIKKAFELGAEGYLVKDTLTPDQIKVEILTALESKK